MRQNISGKAGSYAARHKRRSRWRRLLMALACVVVFCTTYALILPAITLENPEALDAPVCGLEEHIHSESCFEARPEAQHKQFHCCDGGGNLVGISSDLVLHTHDEQCYDPNGVLSCKLPEITLHTHDDSCYQTVEAAPGHTHTPECVTGYEQGALICTLPTEPHVHSEGCYNEAGELICQLPEEAHVHTDECYAQVPVYSCGLEESEDVYEKVLTCGKQELIPHVHTAECYDASGSLICGKPQVVAHQHTEACYDLTTVPAETVLTCTIPEHTHTEECYPQEEEIIPPMESNGILKAPAAPAAEEGETGEGGEGGNTPSGGADYTTKSVTLSHSSDGKTWIALKPGDILNEGEHLQFQWSYEISQGSLSEEKKTIVYDLHLPLDTDSGTVYDGNAPAGTYTVGADGKITILFNDNYITINQSHAGAGSLKFYSTVDKFSWDDNHKIELNVEGKVYEITVVEDSKRTNDLQVTKSGSTFDEATGTVTYTITVKSEKGTGQNVQIQDVRTGAVDNTEYVLGSFKLDGEEANNVVISADGRSFDMTLSPMNPEGTHTITYQVKVSDLANGSIWAGNKVTATSKDEKGNDIHDWQETNQEITTNILEKTGALSEDGKNIIWTVVVNEKKADISNWTLTDIFNGNSYTGEITISPAPGSGEDSVNVNFNGSYTFPTGSNQTYTITYSTPTDADIPMGQDKHNNKVILKDTTDHEVTTETGVALPEPPTSYLTKKAGGYIPSTDEKTATANWTVTIDTSRGPIQQPWVYTDQKGWEDGQWFTASQLEDMRSSLDNALDTAELSELKDSYTIKVKDSTYWDYKDWNAENPLEDTKNYESFQITFTKDVPKGYSIVHQFNSTIKLEGVTFQKTFTNDVTIVSNNHTVQGSDYITYNPESGITIEKTGEAETNIYGKEDDPTWQGIRWQIKLTVPDSKNYDGGALTVVEHLPKDTVLSKLQISSTADGMLREIQPGEEPQVLGKKGFQGESGWFEETYKGNVTQTGQDIQIVIPQELIKVGGNWKGDTEITLTVYVKPTKTLDWDTGDGSAYWVPSASLTNKAELKQGENTLGESESTTKVIKDDESQVLTKSSSTNPDINTIQYTLNVNPKAETLSKDGDPLVLEDTMTVSREEGIRIELLTDTVAVEIVSHDADGNEIVTNLDKSQYSYTYDLVTTSGGGLV